MGSIRLGTSSNDIKEIKKVYFGSTEIKAIYIGSTKIWEGIDPWVALITQLKSLTPSLNVNDLELLGEELYTMMEKGDYDGKAVLYWKDDIAMNACVLTARDAAFPMGYNGWTYVGDYYADELESSMAINTVNVYLLSPNFDSTFSLYYRSSSV